MSNVSSSNSQGVRVPKLRFRDKKGCDYPQYQAETVGTLFNHIIRRNTAMENNNVITNSAEFGLIPQREFFDKDIAIKGNTDKYYIIGQGDFVYNPRKSTSAPYGPFNCYRYPKEGIVSPLYTCLKPLCNEYTDYLLWYFRSSAWHSYIYHNGAQGGARHDRVGMTNVLMDGIPVKLPCIDEQKKISRFLTALEQRIEKQRRLVELLKLYKRGVIQYIFHSSSKEGWSCLQLGRVFKKVTHRNTDGTIKNVITNSAEYGLIPQRDFFDKDIAVEGNTLNYFVIEPDAFVYNPRKSTAAPYGPFNRYTLRESGIISPLYTCLVLEADIDISYLAWYFKSDAWHRFIYDNGSQGVRHDRVSMTDDLLMSIPVAVPPADKQRQITQILDSVETLSLTAQKEYALLDKLRKGFLQQLFI